MALPHASPGESIDIRPLGERLQSEPSVALFKSDDLEVIRLVLLAGKSLPPHKVPGEVTIHCIEGKLEVTTEGNRHLLDAGHLLFLAGNVEHGVGALENASALLTIALRE